MRIKLRPFQINDLEDVFSYAGIFENVEYIAWGPKTREQTSEFIDNCINKLNELPVTDYNFAVINENNEHIGYALIHKKPKNDAMIGWVIKKDFWKKGYATEIAKELLRFGFNDLKIRRIHAICVTDNIGSYRVMELNNMRREAHFRENAYIHDKWYDEYVYAILADEYNINSGGN